MNKIAITIPKVINIKYSKVMEFSNPNNARKINRLRMLNVLLEEGPLTRADLSRRLVLNKISISEIANTLLKEGLITEGDKTSSSKDGGRPGTILKLDAQRAYVLAVDLGFSVLRFAIADLTGSVIRYERLPLEKNTDLAYQIITTLKRIVKTNNKELLALCITVDGEVDNKTGQILKARQFINDPYPLKAKLNELGLTIPITLTTQLQAEVKAEKMFFKQSLASFLFVNWGEFLSSAFITKTETLENMEFAHINVVSQGLCHCGSIGCLDTLASGWGYKNQSLNKQGTPYTVKQLSQTPGGEEIIKQGIDKLGKALALSICATGAKAVIMGGGISSLPDSYFSLLKETCQLALPNHLSTTPLYRGNFKEKGAVQGAIYLALDEYFYSRQLLCSLGYLSY